MREENKTKIKKLTQNQEKIQKLLEGFISSEESLIAMQEQSFKKDDIIHSKAYFLTDKKIIYIEISNIDIFIKFYPLNKFINYQIERDLTVDTDSLEHDSIMKIKISINSDSSIIFRFDKTRDETNYFTSLSDEKKSALNFVLKLNHLLS